jgi:hypothetical protein
LAFEFRNLDLRTREFMIDELDHDVAEGTVYMSPRLSARGAADYVELLRRAITSHDEQWLANQLRAEGRLNPTEQRRTKSGQTRAQVPVSAPWTLAEGEFNRYYVRGVCRRAIDEDISEVIVYRAQAVANPRAESQRMIGRAVDPHALLTDLRRSPGVEPALGLPPGPNSGISIQLR